MSLEKGNDTYTLHYLEPELVSRNPVAFDTERKEYRFIAKDITEADKHADWFLTQGVVSCNHVKKCREGKKLNKDLPFQVIKCYYPAPMLDLTGS